MKKDEFYVTFEDAVEKEIIISTIESYGCKWDGYNTGRIEKYVSVCDGLWWLSEHLASNSEVVLLFDQFMKKYGTNKMKEKINKALIDFKFNKEQLSVAIGMSKPYITKMLTIPQSKKVQDKVIGLIDGLYNPEKSIGKICVDLTLDPSFQKVIDETKDEIERVAKENKSLKNTNNNLNSELNSLRKTLDHKDQVLDKRNDLYASLELEKADLERSVKVWKGECFSVQSDLDESRNEIITLKNQHQEKINKIMDGARVLKKDLYASKNKIKNERFIFVIVFAIMCALLIISHWVV